MSQFHFLYPHWLWGLVLIPLVFLWVWMRRSKPTQWDSLVDPELMPFVLTGQERKRKIWSLLIFLVLSALAFLAMAGPAWEKREVPVFRQQQPLVIALDLSTSMYAQDVSPSRLELARFKLIDLLKARKDAQNALVVFAGDAFVVSPLTDDGRTIDAQMRGLTPDIMPAQGSRTDLAILKSIELLQQANLRHGAIVLLTDGTSDLSSSEAAAQQAREAGYEVSILALGTEVGAPPILPNRGNLRDAQGKTVIAKLNVADLRQIATVGGGIFAQATLQSLEVEQLVNHWNAKTAATDLLKDKERQIDTWVNEGYWLILGMLPLALLVFRRGWLVVLALAFLLPQTSTPVQAAGWNDLWKTPDQQGLAAFKAGDAQQAEALFRDPDWKAAAAYKAGNYAEAEQLYAQSKTINGLYNYGNALAQQNKIDEAIAAYEKVLAQNPHHEDAKYNLELLKKKKQEQQQGQQQDDQQTQQNQQQSQEQNNQNNQGQQDQTNQQQNQQQEQQAQPPKQEQEQKHPEPQQSESEQQKAEQQPTESESEDNKESQEQQQAAEQWLRRIPDDPAGLWRRKFQYQYQQRGAKSQGEEAW